MFGMDSIRHRLRHHNNTGARLRSVVRLFHIHRSTERRNSQLSDKLQMGIPRIRNEKKEHRHTLSRCMGRKHTAQHLRHLHTDRIVRPVLHVLKNHRFRHSGCILELPDAI